MYALCLLFSGAAARAATPAVSETAHAEGLAALPVVAPVVACGALANADLNGSVGAKTHITSAKEVADGKPAPYCEVTGYVEPANKFEVRLPLKTWTQRYVQTGCGGLCGNVRIDVPNAQDCFPATHGEFVLASTDMGHEGGMDGEFGKDAQLRVDFAYRSLHVTALAAKALIAKFYGQAPKYSYFSGCSDGGREALIEAQRFPEDFDGIAAGAPAMNFTTQNTFYHGWNAVTNTDANGQPILTTTELPVLHKAALAACDAADGLKDGLISEPAACHFDPAVTECRAGETQSKDTPQCLTHAQVEVAKEIYAGAHDAGGDKLVISGPLPGSELAWGGVYIPSPGSSHTMSPMIALGVLKYLAYETNPDASSYTLKDLAFTKENFEATTQLHALYDATDPDLKPFATKGGKLILWHGYADPHISPLNTVAYYTAMQQTMGEDAVKQFARLYLFPGGYHCGGGEGPFRFDLMDAIMAWVEGGKAPFALIASHEKGGMRGPVAGVPAGMPHGGPPAGAMGPGAGGPPPGAMGEPATKAVVDRTRPVYPYPLTARYKGTGSIDEASSFEPGPAKPVPSERLEWLGSKFYAPDYEVWCSGDGSKLSCSKNRE
ncbi:tannase/feruloyl esterase family alpha/beta hydrolase [Silvibacterium sp.]|uniref:tannase/feruloyl esterase family alpha/beta hydrolase n=1 Tax=Silvibacterium sp. TaxID=1964179 RepID=UPI0039E5928E